MRNDILLSGVLSSPRGEGRVWYGLEDNAVIAQSNAKRERGGFIETALPGYALVLVRRDREIGRASPIAVAIAPLLRPLFRVCAAWLARRGIAGHLPR